MFGRMTPRVIICFVLSLFIIGSINGQSNGPHFCQALEENNKRMSYSLSVPKESHFDHFIFIGGNAWKVGLGSSLTKRQAVPIDPTTDDPSSDLSSTTETVGNGSQPDISAKEFKLDQLYGSKFMETPFFDVNYKCMFSMRYVKNIAALPNSSVPDSSTKNLIGGLTEDSKLIKWIIIPRNADNDRMDDPLPTLPFDALGERKKRQSTDNSTEMPTPTSATDAPLMDLTTNFAAGYEPEVAFNAMANIDKTTIVFVDTKLESAKYTTTFEGYWVTDPDNGQWKQLSKWQRVRFRRQTQQNDVIPESIWQLGGQELYKIKGIFPVQMDHTNNGSIILIEECSSKDNPCTGSISYKYCIVSDTEKQPTDLGKPCNENNLKLLIDCTLPWETTTPLPDSSPIDENNPGGGEGNSTGEVGPNGEGNDSGSGPDDGNNQAPNGPVETPQSSKEPEKSGGKTWLWILIVVIIIIIIALIVVFMMCSKGKSKEGSGAPPEAASPAAGSSAGSSQATPPPSAAPIGGSAKPSQSGLQKSPSTLSTASTRSKMSGSAI